MALMGKDEHVHRSWHGSADSHPLSMFPSLLGKLQCEAVLTRPALECGEVPQSDGQGAVVALVEDRKSTRLNSSHTVISYAVFCLKKKNKANHSDRGERLLDVVELERLDDGLDLLHLRPPPESRWGVPTRAS